MPSKEISITISNLDVERYLGCSSEHADVLWTELLANYDLEEILEEEAMYTFSNLIMRLISDNPGLATDPTPPA